MRTKTNSLFVALAALACVPSALAQNPVITSLSQNGVLVCSNLNPGSVASVEWAPSVTGPWQPDWTSLAAVAVDTNRTITVSVPMFYRVRGFSEGIFTSDGMALVPAGTFTIGDTIDGDLALSDAQPTNVYVSAFYMDTNLVSGIQWQAVLAYATNHGHVLIATPAQSEGYARQPNHPISLSRWDDVVNWCNARSEQAGLTPVYYGDAGLTEVYTNGVTQTNGIFPDWTASGYGLPTEAEWERAARGGLSGQRFPWGNLISWTNANYWGNNQVLSIGTWGSYFTYGLSPFGVNPVYSNSPAPFTSPVGSFPPNGYGLYDMAGNNYQWCWDWYAAPPYPVGSAYLGGSDPRGPATGSNRVVRTCSWNGFANAARCAFRSFASPTVVRGQQCFRCVRRP